MTWSNQHGKELEGWQKLFDAGRPPPEPFFQQPEIFAHLQAYWRVFNWLGTHRQIGMGVGPIPMLLCEQYLVERLGLDGDELDYALDLIRAVDIEYVSLMNKVDDEKRPGIRVNPKDAQGVKDMFNRLAGSGAPAKPNRKGKPKKKDGVD